MCFLSGIYPVPSYRDKCLNTPRIVSDNRSGFQLRRNTTADFDKTAAQFNAFLGELGVQTIPTDISFEVSTADGAFEWDSYSISSFVDKLSHLFNP